LLSYALKRIVRSWKLFAAIILGMMLAATFFGGVNVAADTIARQALDRQLETTPVDFRIQQSSFGFTTTVPTPTYQALATAVGQVGGVLSTEMRGDAEDATNYTLPRIKAVQDGSSLYKHLTITGQPLTLPNQTLLSTASSLAKNHKIGDVIRYRIGQNVNSPYNISLKIVGLVSLDSIAFNTLISTVGQVYGLGADVQSIMIISWDQTYTKVLDWAYQQYTNPNPVLRRQIYGVTAYVDVYLDRNSVISPVDIDGSVAQVAQIAAQISNTAARYDFTSTDYILPPLQGLAPSILSLRVAFTVFSIPVFFMAWYVGRTVSRASFNLRRREIGLLLTKGFSRTQLFRHFLVEALIVGLLAGILGLSLAFALDPFFVQVLSGGFQGSVFLSWETAGVTVIFTLILTFISIFSPARQAASMDPAKALREYVYVEDVQASKKRGALLAFSLGLYKIILLLLGINFITLTRIGFAGGFLLFLIILVLAFVDFGLTFVGPFLFLYGATQLSTGLAFRFHNWLSSVSRRLVGDIASLASKSVFRNPRRVTGLVFLVALIAGYSIWVIGDLASMEDYNMRQAELRVGSDLRILNVGPNATLIASHLRQAWSNNVTGATPEFEAQLYLQALGANIRLKAIDTQTWKQGAYYEPEWFSAIPDLLFQQLQIDSRSVILDRGLASYFDINLGGNLTISQPPISLGLRVVGFFGPDYSKLSQPFITRGFSSFYPQGWSYVSQTLISQYPTLFSTTNSVLVKVASNVAPQDLANSIQRAYPSTYVQIAQVAPQEAGGIVSKGILNVLRLGTVFAAAAACIGVGTVSYAGFKEREKETTMIAVRGLSYRQIFGLLVTEVLPLVLYALILAGTVGLITVRGDIAALNSQNLSPDFYSLLAPRRLTFPAPSQTTLGVIIGLLLLGVFLPAIAFARKDLSKMSRTVRFA
jgi:ABC-type antimicrobial peptide transport system permease subunit